MTSSAGRRARVVAVTATIVAGLPLGACGSSTSSGVAPPPATPSSATGSQAPSATPSKRTRPTPSSEPSSDAPTEFNPPGDIPDNAVFVDHQVAGSRVHVSVPEGWARSRAGGVTTYTDKYNSIGIEVRPAAKAPTPRQAQRVEVPRLRRTVSHFQLQGVGVVQRQHGAAVHIVYLMDSAPNPVTGKVVRDVVEEFEFWHHGQTAVLSLSGPEHADNVDPWQIVSDSLHWQ